MTEVSQIALRPLTAADLPRLAEIDRTETIPAAYLQHGDRLEEITVNWQASPWDPDGDHEHSVAHEIAFCRSHLDRGGRLLGAFVAGPDGADTLAGVGLMTPEVRPGVAQLAFLHVSEPYRGHGAGRALVAALEQLARDSGAAQMVVSATPTKATVDFYQSFGFVPDADPLPELLALEPADIHLRKQLA